MGDGIFPPTLRFNLRARTRVRIDDSMSWLTIFGKAREQYINQRIQTTHPFNTHPVGLWASNEVESA